MTPQSLALNGRVTSWW